MTRKVSLSIAGVLVATLLVGGTLEVLAQRGGRGGGGRGGGGRGGGGMSRGGGGGMSRGGMGGGMRSSARPSVSRPASRPAGGGNFGGAGGIGRPGGVGGVGSVGGVGGVGGVGAVGGVGGVGGAGRVAARPGGGNINNVRVNNIDTDGDWGGGGCWGGNCGCCHNPVAAGLAVGAAAAITSAAIGSTVYSLPSGCQTVIVNGITYSDCNGTYYQPQFVGTETSYVVVSDPD